MPLKSELPQGTLDLLILKIAALGPVHGYAIAQRLQQVSRDVVQVPQGSLYPALAPARKPRPLSCRVEGDRDRARGQVLSPDAERAGAARNRGGKLGAIDESGGSNPQIV